jgi:hypothetical protein
MLKQKGLAAIEWMAIPLIWKQGLRIVCLSHAPKIE